MRGRRDALPLRVARCRGLCVTITNPEDTSITAERSCYVGEKPHDAVAMAKRLRADAQRCLRLARDITDASAVANLESYARELEQQARALEDAPKSPRRLTEKHD